MTYHELIYHIQVLEERFPVETWKVNGVHVWPLVRHILCSHIESTGFVTPTVSRLRIVRILSFITKILKWVSAKFLDFKGNRNIDSAECLFVFSSDNRTRIGSKWITEHLFGILNYLEKKGYRYHSIEDASNGAIRLPRYDRSQLIMVSLLLRRHIKEYEAHKQNVHLPEYLQFVESLKMYFPECVQLVQLEKIEKLVLELEILKDYFKTILMKTQAKYAFAICYYNRLGWALNWACSELGIPSHDVQHGVAGELNHSYSNWNKIPKSGFELLPDVFLSWSEEDANAVNKWAKSVSSKHIAVPLGNTWIETWRGKKNPLVNLLDRDLVKRLNDADIYILFTHQLAYKIPEWIFSAVEQSPSNWTWGVRIHPASQECEKKRMYALTSKITNLDLEFTNGLPLPVILNKCNVHITGWSAVVYEASLFSVHSIVTTKNGKELFQKEIESGTCRYSANQYELVNFIRDIISQNDSRSISHKDVDFVLENLLFKR